MKHILVVDFSKRAKDLRYMKRILREEQRDRFTNLKNYLYMKRKKRI